MSDAWTVVKVGGSLFDWPELGVKLTAWLDRIDASRILLVPGGGAAADAVRRLDRIHHLGDEASHWLAIAAMSVNARFLLALLPLASLIESLAGASGPPIFVLDSLPFFRADEARIGHLPHTWQVTSDSLAVRAAVLAEARELILLKSIAWPGTNWPDAASAGVVDGYFVRAINEADAEMNVRIVNLRTEG